MPVVRELKAIKSEGGAKAPAHDPARIKDLQATIDFVFNAGRCFEIQNCLGFGAAKCKQQLRVGYAAVVRHVWLCSPGQTPVRGGVTTHRDFNVQSPPGMGLASCLVLRSRSSSRIFYIFL